MGEHAESRREAIAMARRIDRWRIYLCSMAMDARELGLIDKARMKRIIERIDKMTVPEMIRILEAVDGDGPAAAEDRREAAVGV